MAGSIRLHSLGRRATRILASRLSEQSHVGALAGLCCLSLCSTRMQKLLIPRMLWDCY